MEEREPAENQSGRSRIEVHKPGRDSNDEPAEPERKLQESPISAAPSFPERSSEGSNRYVLLAVLEEAGSPVASLQPSNGLVALAIPRNSSLAKRFAKGGLYRFENGSYRVKYICLEVFETPAEAFAAYPEGMRVSTNPPTFLHWREAVENSVLSEGNWQLG